MGRGGRARPASRPRLRPLLPHPHAPRGEHGAKGRAVLCRNADEGEEDKTVQALTVKAVTAESGRRLYNTLTTFRPELELDDEGRPFVVVRFDTDRELVELLNILHLFLDQSMNDDESVGSVSVAVDGRSYGLH